MFDLDKLIKENNKIKKVKLEREYLGKFKVFLAMGKKVANLGLCVREIDGDKTPKKKYLHVFLARIHVIVRKKNNI